ncbi:tetraspanin-17 isoform X1 [Pongo pygmaeus]|uniref:tetraspanin-17 isoform X1 n=1 Tax=Pongo pygmaeus TaxID=9600 RepID=UPI0023E2EC51|nr:tetraspanin-17 isoform X1 [Pongo pygmaeus]XP_054412293.1 tetraspanin-17 isoform X1 [Pongo abelii]
MPGKHQHFQEPEVGCCGKYFLFGFNIVFWVLGALFLAIGLWAWGEKGVLSNISALTDLGGLDPVWLFVVVGGVMSVLGFAGCIGALRENTFLLKFFSVFLGLIFFLELATGILAFVFKDWIRDQLNLFINNNVKAYRDDIDLQNLIDFAQEYWSCCGARGPNDWNLNIYFNCTDLNPSRERCGVPFSCCVRDPAEDVLNTQCGYDVRLKLELEQQGFIHTKGCVGQFEKWLQDNLIVVAGVFMGIALLQVPLWPHVPLPLPGPPSLSPHLSSVLQIFGICLAQNLVSDIKAVKANWSKWNDDFENHWLTPTISEVLSTVGPQQNSLIGVPGPAPPSRHVFFGLGGLYPEPTFKNW